MDEQIERPAILLLIPHRSACDCILNPRMAIQRGVGEGTRMSWTAQQMSVVCHSQHYLAYHERYCQQDRCGCHVIFATLHIACTFRGMLNASHMLINSHRISCCMDCDLLCCHDFHDCHAMLLVANSNPCHTMPRINDILLQAPIYCNHFDISLSS